MAATRNMQYLSKSRITSGVGRAQPMLGHSMDTLRLRVSYPGHAGPAFSRLQYGNAEASRGVWGLHAPPENFGTFELLKSILGLLTQSNKVC